MRRTVTYDLESVIEHSGIDNAAHYMSYSRTIFVFTSSIVFKIISIRNVFYFSLISLTFFCFH